MLWFSKQPASTPQAVARDAIRLAPLPVELDAAVVERLLSAVTAGAQAMGGVEALLEALAAKGALFAQLLAEPEIERLDLARAERLLATVFTARRRLYPALERLGADRLRPAVGNLLFGAAPLAGRIAAFVAAIPVDEAEGRDGARRAQKQRGAARDFAAELLHFREPERYPLMSRWIWDEGTQSGALRELARDADRMPQIALPNAPETCEALRRWVADRIAAHGVYRDVHYWIDLVLAQAYVNYVRSMAEGNLGGDFGRGARPEEQLAKLLGLDALRDGAPSRVKKAAAA